MPTFGSTDGRSRPTIRSIRWTALLSSRVSTALRLSPYAKTLFNVFQTSLWKSSALRILTFDCGLASTFFMVAFCMLHDLLCGRTIMATTTSIAEVHLTFGNWLKDLLFLG